MVSSVEVRLFSIRACLLAATSALTLLSGCAATQPSAETGERIAIAATNLEDAVVVDCQLPGKLRKLGGTRNYLTPGKLIRTSAIACRTRGGEYTLGDLSSGTLSLRRWLPLAENGDPEAQYYVARIYANGMDNVAIDYAAAAHWYQKAANQNFNEALQELGYLYEQGLGVARDELKALNLQRQASGLGDSLDYAYKIADAEAQAERLASELAAANGALREVQLALSDSQSRLSSARAANRRQELQLVRLVAELDVARRTGSQASTASLEQSLLAAQRQLEESQKTVLALERERDEVKLALDLQIMGGQATQLELREMLVRTERAEAQASSMASQLAEAQQRLIRSEEEVRDLRASYREQSGQLAAERARLLEARSVSDSDAAAYLAAREADVAAKDMRVAALQSQVEVLKREVAEAAGSDVEAQLRVQLENLQARYDTEIEALRRDRERLEADFRKSSQQLSGEYADAQRRLAERGEELGTARRDVERLEAEADELRARVARLEQEQFLAARQSGSEVELLTAQLSQARQQAVAQRATLEELRAQKSALEAELHASRLALQAELAAGRAQNDDELELMRAEIAGAESTIRVQTLRIEKLEREVRQRDIQLAELRTGAGTGMPEPVSAQVRNAVAVLEMARTSPDLGRFHALLIGNQDYENLGPLKTPIRDVHEIADLLETRYGFTIEILTNVNSDQIAAKLSEYSNKLTPQDNFLVYYSGKGATPPGPPDRAYWLGIEAKREYETDQWLLAEIISATVNTFKAKRVLFVTDSCFSTRRARPSSAFVRDRLDPDRFRRFAPRKARMVLTSGANEPIYDEQQGTAHSLFATYFMEILRQNTNVMSGEMLSFEMARRVAERIDDPARAKPTYTSLAGTGHDFGEFYFVPAKRSTMVADAF